jgi:hypothetical protein
VIEKTIYSLLTSNAPLTGAVGGNIAHGLRLQGDTLPAVAFQVTGDDALTLSQTLRAASVTVMSVDDDPLGALTVADLVKAAMTTSGSLVAGHYVRVNTFLGRTVQPLAPGEGNENLPAVVESNFEVMYV